MQFIDLKSQHQRINKAVNRAINAVFEHGQYIMGPEVAQLEQVLAEYVGVEHCIGVSSGTDALLIAMLALGIKANDEVITTPFSFYATAETILMLGARPVFVDIDSKTYNLDAKLLEYAITNKTKAIIPVSLYGQCADYDAINIIAEKYQIPVIEDAAQSFGANYKGRRSCGLTTIGCTSFFPSKPLGCYGDGGACFTNDLALAEEMKSIRVHGQKGRYNHVSMGVNGRLDTIQAAVLLEKFKIFPDELERRQQVAALYDKYLKGTVPAPYIAPENDSCYGQYTIAVENRLHLCEQLKAANIPTATHYSKALHQQPYLVGLNENWGSHPIAEQAAQQVVSLPFHPYMTEMDVKNVCQEVVACLSKQLA